MDETNTQGTMSAEEFDTLLSSLNGGTEGEEGTEPTGTQVQATQTQTVTQQDPATEATQPASAEPIEGTGLTEGQTDPEPKSNRAFAQMRVANTQYAKVLGSLLQNMGLDASLATDPQKVQSLLDEAQTSKQAEEMKVPPELLTRLNQLERTNAMHEQERLKNLALSGFETVRDKYKLSQKELTDFAQQLMDSGMNPFAREVDMDMAYRTHNLDRIIAAETQRAVQEALSKQQTAQAHSTTPTATMGKPSSAQTSGDEIDTMARFDNFLRTI